MAMEGGDTSPLCRQIIGLLSVTAFGTLELRFTVDSLKMRRLGCELFRRLDRAHGARCTIDSDRYAEVFSAALRSQSSGRREAKERTSFLPFSST